MRDLDRIQKTEAVVITHRDYGEADRILKVFTPELGKITILAKGVRKSGSRKAPHIEPFTHSSFILAKGQSFWILTQADSINIFNGIYEDLQKTGMAAYLLELADRLTVEEQPDPSLFRLIVDSLKQINLAEDVFIPALYFEIRILEVTGFRPDLFQCVSCKKDIIQEDQYFSIPHGGVICPKCGQLEQNLLPVTQETLKYLRHFQRSKFKELERLRIPKSVSKSMRRILDPYTSSITERKLKSPEFILQIKRLSGD